MESYFECHCIQETPEWIETTSLDEFSSFLVRQMDLINQKELSIDVNCFSIMNFVPVLSVEKLMKILYRFVHTRYCSQSRSTILGLVRLFLESIPPRYVNPFVETLHPKIRVDVQRSVSFSEEMQRIIDFDDQEDGLSCNLHMRNHVQRKISHSRISKYQIPLLDLKDGQFDDYIRLVQNLLSIEWNFFNIWKF